MRHVFLALLVVCITASFVQAELFPASGPPGATVTIGGTAFGEFVSTAENRVDFNGVPALIQLWEPDLVMVKVPLGARSGDVTVSGTKGTVVAGRFAIQQVKITKLVPPEAEPGSVLTIEGEHFGNTAGSRDPNTMFGVNRVLINGILSEILKWRPGKIDVKIPANAKSGDVVVQLASSDPLPDGSCCAPVKYAESNRMPVSLIPSISFAPNRGPVGTKVVLSGQQFGDAKGPNDAITIGGKPVTIAKWAPRTIVVHVPLNAVSGPVTFQQDGRARTLGQFELVEPGSDGLFPAQGPIGTLVHIKGKNFGVFSEAGSTAYAFDFDPGQNRVEIGGVPAIIHRWQDNEINVWVPYSAKSGPVVVKRGGTIPKPDGTCCAKQDVVDLEVGSFTVQTPKVTSYSPKEAGIDEIVTLKGEGFGEFLKIAEATRLELNTDAHDWKNYRLGPDVSRTEVLVNGVAAVVVSWKDTEIKVQVPRRHVFGFGHPEGFYVDPTKGEIVVRRGSWDLLKNGRCCSRKQWQSAVAGEFKILPRGLPHKEFFYDYTQEPWRTDQAP
ncbi:MAG: IPT/TIG domain-containing protein [Nitrospira sp.]|nr:IPT/TIG domain-containing protein [Nitrospira sp.]